jgi:CBS domain containing-hemolysin-like protein
MTDDPSSRSATPRRPGGVLAFLNVFRGDRDSDASASAAPPPSDGGELVRLARDFEGLSVGDVMKPRAAIIAIDRDCTFAEVVARFVEAEHSRMPVFKDTLDEPVGVIHVKDVFRLMARKTGKPKPEDQILHGRRQLVRKALYVPPSMRAADLLAMMRARRSHMALVIDEFGGVDGLVTLEDLLETLVGDISDEHDEDEEDFTPIVEDAHGWVVDGRTPLEELENAIGDGVDLAPPDLDEEIDTVAGLVNSLAGHVPQRHEKIAHPGGFSLEVLAADPRRVKRVRVRRAPVEAEA